MKKLQEQDKTRKDEKIKEHRALEEYERKCRKKEREEAINKAKENDELKRERLRQQKDRELQISMEVLILL